VPRSLGLAGIGDDKYARAFLLGVKCAVLLTRHHGQSDASLAQAIVSAQKHAVAEAERLRNVSVPIHPDIA
jgi:hypothetical protein